MEMFCTWRTALIGMYTILDFLGGDRLLSHQGQYLDHADI